MRTPRTVATAVAATVVLCLAITASASAVVVNPQTWQKVSTRTAAKMHVTYSGGGSFNICGQMQSSGGYRFDLTPCPPANPFNFTVADSACVARYADWWIYNGDNNAHNINVTWSQTC